MKKEKTKMLAIGFGSEKSKPTYTYFFDALRKRQEQTGKRIYAWEFVQLLLDNLASPADMSRPKNEQE